MITDVPSAEDLRRHMVDELEASGAIRSPAWRDAFLSVPRHQFAPDFTVRADGKLHRYREGEHAWLVSAYKDVSLLTQFDRDGTATSSSTQPSLMARMLDSLDIHDGQMVLEIGAGTGYNCALLSHRLGSDHVVTVDIDPDLVEAARIRLQGAGYAPTLVAGDGMAGYPAHAPYDRLLATCGVGRIPDAWRRQIRPGGVIVANIGAALVRLTVADDETAMGLFLPELATFMTARPTADAIAIRAQRLVEPLLTWTGRTRTINVPVSLDVPGPQFLASLVHPAINEISLIDDSGALTRCLFDRDTASWARITMSDVTTGRLEYGGPRDLWAEREPLLNHWRDAGRPGHDRYGLTVSPDGTHRLWLDDPEGEGWLLPA
ncbi:protein-L-isoaspartate(D-aspartate) O-methyltransferase [Streptomyces albus subsp. albus]|nr:protein-L-isoaspartate(D-aspartate) O-methyltransferase [Streptomyces albus subsp. albus]